MYFEYFFVCSFLIIFFGLFRVDRRDRELSCLHVDTVGGIRHVLWEETSVVSEVLNSQGR